MIARDAWTDYARQRGVEPEERPLGLAPGRPRAQPEDEFRQTIQELATLHGCAGGTSRTAGA